MSSYTGSFDFTDIAKDVQVWYVLELPTDACTLAAKAGGARADLSSGILTAALSPCAPARPWAVCGCASTWRSHVRKVDVVNAHQV